MNAQKDIKAKPVRYNGIPMRSKTEGKWARFFDIMGMPYEYEMHSGDGYLPDFKLSQLSFDSSPIFAPVYFEAKGEHAVDDCVDKINKFCNNGSNVVVLSYGFPMDYHAYEVAYSQKPFCYSNYFSFDGNRRKIVVFQKDIGFTYLPSNKEKRNEIIKTMTDAFAEANDYKFEEISYEEYQASLLQYSSKVDQNNKSKTMTQREMADICRRITASRKRFEPMVSQIELIQLSFPGKYDNERQINRLYKRLSDGTPYPGEEEYYDILLTTLRGIADGKIIRLKKVTKRKSRSKYLENVPQSTNESSNENRPIISLYKTSLSEYGRFVGLTRAMNTSPDELISRWIKEFMEKFEFWKESLSNGGL